MKVWSVLNLDLKLTKIIIFLALTSVIAQEQSNDLLIPNDNNTHVDNIQNTTILNDTNNTNIPLIHWASSGEPHQVVEAFSGLYWIYLLYSLCSLTLAGLFSGLTIGYLSLDRKFLNHILKNGSDEEKNYATRILPIMDQKNWLLSTLVIANAFCVQALPICLDAIIPSYIAVFISTALIILFGEVLPQNYFTGPSQLRIASFMAPFVKILMKILFFLAKPLALFMENLLKADKGKRLTKLEKGSTFELTEKSSSFELESQDKLYGKDIKEVGLSGDEIKLVSSTIDLKDTLAIKKMVPIAKTFMLSDQTIITSDLIKRIYGSNHSKIPIYHEKNKNDMLGFIKSKTLITYFESMINKTISQSGILIEQILILSKDVSLLELFMIFHENHTRIAFLNNESIKDKNGQSLINKNELINDPFKRMVPLNLIGMITYKDIMQVMLERQLTDKVLKSSINIYRADTSRDQIKNEDYLKTPPARNVVELASPNKIQEIQM